MTELAKPVPKQENPFISLVFNVVIPTLILIKLSPEARLGAKWALVLGCALPIGYGVYDYLKRRQINFFSVIGLAAVLIKGLFGLFELPAIWIAVSESSIPLIFAGAVLWSTRWRKPLIEVFMLHPSMVDRDKIAHRLKERHTGHELHPLMVRTSYLLSGTLLISAALNFILVKVVVKSPPGTEKFTEELGKQHGMQFLVIGLPMMVLTLLVFTYLVRGLTKITGLKLTELAHGADEPTKD